MKNNPNPAILGQAAGLILLAGSTFLMLTKTHPWLPILDDANLLIHESGHVFLSPLGLMAGFLGGSIMQLLVPAVSLIYFKLSKQFYALGFSLFWLGDNLINISTYAKDARTMLLPLINHDRVHDWNWILKQWHLLAFDQVIGNSLLVLGIAACLAGLTVSALTFFRQVRQLSQQNVVK
jgi:hypothetical protein